MTPDSFKRLFFKNFRVHHLHHLGDIFLHLVLIEAKTTQNPLSMDCSGSGNRR